MKILLVEDSETLLDVLPALFKARGHQVATAADGKEALEALKQWIPDIVVTDMMMPGMDGFQMLRQLQVNPDLAKIRVIVLTGKPMDDSTTQLIEQEPNVVKVFQKPLDERTLLNFLDEQAQKAGLAPGPVDKGYISDPKDFASYFPSLELGKLPGEDKDKNKPA